jgi:hypothetical protein
MLPLETLTTEILLIMKDVSDKYCIAGQAKDENMAHARCMLDT